MSDDSSHPAESSNAARMQLDSDALHEGDGGYAIDCPECGSFVTLARIVETGRCPGSLDADVTEVEDDDEQLQEPGCTAELSLELVWES